MTQGFKYFMVFLSQSTKEKNEEEKKKKVEKWPVTENVPYKLFKPCPDLKSISTRCITNKDEGSTWKWHGYEWAAGLKIAI